MATVGKLIISLSVMGFCLLLTTFVAYLMGINSDTVAKTSDFLDQSRYLLLTARVAFIFAIWVYWEPISNKIYSQTIVNYRQKREVIKTFRHRFLIFFLAIELLLAQNLLGYLLGKLV